MSTELKKTNIGLKKNKPNPKSAAKSSKVIIKKKLKKIFTARDVSRPVIQTVPEFREFECGQNVELPNNNKSIKIIEKLAIGRCCEVYIGEEEVAGLSVRRAVKVFIRGQNYKGALARELKFLEVLTPHPHIVLPLGYFQCEDKDILIHELLSKTLKDILLIHGSGHRRPSEFLIISLAKDLMRGLSHMHKNGIVHGDLKPQNIMWCGEEECFKLIDFGVSFSTSENIRHAIQSRAYQAPETTIWNKWLQVNAHRSHDTTGCIRPGPLSDIWSAGCIVAELMCGVKVFQVGWNGEDVNSSLRESLHKVSNCYLTLTDFLSKASNWFQRAMAHSWEDRASADELLKDTFLTGSAPSPSIFDSLLLPSTVLRLMKIIRPETGTHRSELVREILKKVESLHPEEHKIDEASGSLYILFTTVHNSMTALQTLRNTCVGGYTIIPTFYSLDKWLNEEFY